MGATTTHDEQTRARALELAQQVGCSNAARELGVKLSTVKSWVRRAGVQPAGAAERLPAIQASIASLAERKAAMADGLLADAQRLRAQLFAPVVEKHVTTVSDGREMGSHVEVVDVPLGRPKPSDQRQIMVALAIAVDKVQILTGEATERIEQLTRESTAEPSERAREIVDELARRREAKAS